MAVQDVTADSYDHFRMSRRFALLHFWAAWNRVDDRMKQEMELLSQSIPESVTLGQMDVDAAGSAETCSQIGLATVPAVALYRDGKVVDIVPGLQDAARLTERLRAIIDGTYSDKFERPWWKLW